MKIAVTSASGQLGTAIAQHLISKIDKAHVIGLARTPEKAKHLGIKIHPGDYNNKEHFLTGLKGIDTVVILSGNDYPEKRIEQHRNIINAAKANKVQKIVYTSIIGNPEKTAFSPVIKSNRQTEEDIRNSGLEWSIGRNGLYLEPDLEYIDQYLKLGGISNCAGNGLCGYTSRSELGTAYAEMALSNEHNNDTYNLLGQPISQEELANTINKVFGTNLSYKAMSAEAYIKDRQNELGEFLGTIIGGIYEGIANGAFDLKSDFEKATGRPHKSLEQMMLDFKT